jgi:hypothetical protein
MNNDKRKSLRRTLRQPAMMLNVNGSMLGLCDMLDVSATGAKLMPRESIDVPDEFILQLTRNRNVMRRCKVAWRAASAVGVRFTRAQMVDKVPA